MQSSPTSKLINSTCLRCGGRFETKEVTLFRFRFAADRYCDVCRSAEKVQDEQREADILWRRAMVPPVYADCTFANFERVPGTEDALGRAERWVREFRSGTSLSSGLMFWGPPGSGKTHLAVAILRQSVYSHRAARAVLINVPEWLNAVRNAWHSTDVEEPAAPEGYDLVVLDDLGAENWSDWAKDRIYSLINNREQNGRLTFVTTNSEPADLARRVGGATASRLRRLCSPVQMAPSRDFREVLTERERTVTAERQSA